jgi:hypothetical protein
VLVSVTVLLTLAALGFGAAAAGSGPRQPRLALDRMQPLTVKGSGFRAHERVRLVLHQAAGPARRRATASAGGRFSSVFGGVTADRCSGFWVSASGSAGSHAKLVRRAHPECPPP